MENSAGQPGSSTQRKVALRRAVIRTDSALLQRTAQFTDGSTGAVEMKWSEIKRVAAFRRDVLTRPVFCVAITDPANVVVLDESMQGWKPLIKALSKRLSQSPSFSEWREKIGRGSADSHWTILFSAHN
jgi:hypothetical protein